MRILGIETSCDETSAAVVEVRGFARPRFSVLSNVVASQIKIHAQYGGVVPEVAARNHVAKILPVVDKAIQRVNHKSIDLIAVTAGPGLITSLLVGVETAKALSVVWGIPVVPVNHLAGHIYSALLPAQRISNLESRISKQVQNPKSKIQNPNIEFPALCLIVSGGHTELILMNGYGRHKLIGQTLDDAAGEAFDKIGKMLGLPYPGGPNLARLAEKGNPQVYDFPRPMIHNLDFFVKGGSASGGNFSFSGLKTSALYFIKTLKHKNIKTKLPNICASVQAAIVDVLVAKTVAAARAYRVKTVLLGGGVSANKMLRKKLGEELNHISPSLTYHLSPITYTTDNAAMIAAAGFFKVQNGWKGLSKQQRLTRYSWEKLFVNPNWDL